VSDNLEEVSAAEAIELSQGESWLVDVREPDEWETGHAAGAYSLPMSQLSERMGELPQDATLLVICHSGARSLRVTSALSAAGYNAINVQGGTMAWQSAGGAIVADGPAGQPA
jgi:rhodanese-related sulfurtransferase